MIDVVDQTVVVREGAPLIWYLHRWPVDTAVGQLAICLAWRELTELDQADVRAERLRAKGALLT